MMRSTAHFKAEGRQICRGKGMALQALTRSVSTFLLDWDRTSCSMTHHRRSPLRTFFRRFSDMRLLGTRTGIIAFLKSSVHPWMILASRCDDRGTARIEAGHQAIWALHVRMRPSHLAGILTQSPRWR